jgi:hypothetical protein
MCADLPLPMMVVLFRKKIVRNIRRKSHATSAEQKLRVKLNVGGALFCREQKRAVIYYNFLQRNRRIVPFISETAAATSVTILDKAET